MNRILSAAVVLLGSATGAHAIQVQLSGALNIGPTGSVGPLAIGQTQSHNFIDASGRFRGTVEARNVLVGDIQTLELKLTHLRYETWLPGPAETVTFEVIQDFAVSNAFTGQATGRQNFNGVANILAAGQLAQIDARSFQESTELPRLQYNPGAQYSTTGGGWRPTNLNLTSPQSVSVSGAYRIRNVYTFTLDTNAACDWMAIEIANSSMHAGGYAELVLVPLPAGGWAGMASLGCVAVMGQIRRRRLHRA